MKIKYLKIRNIASIEKGDIDFENGLIDHETGLPSSLFLITGDTGSGKSVILDCISMALYATTPRVKSVSDSRNNIYKNNDGEEISVNNIRQYTRIGISWKDDCYTELYFTGNDGIDYISRFSLGRTSHRNYRDPVWKLTVDSSQTIDKRDEIKERIQKAVGLTFEQFSRMAMLAQGQFATFLTGKKEERERILEQLTATDIFSRYGDAISDIFKRSRQDREVSAKLYEEFGKKILSNESRMQLESELEEKRILANKLNAELDKLRRSLSHTEAVLKAKNDIAGLNAENAELKGIEDSPDFRKSAALIALWDKTESERKLLTDKLEASQKVGSDIRTLQEMKAEFSRLSEDISSRKNATDLRTLYLEKEGIWIKTKEPLNKIFANSSLTILKIKNYLALMKESEQKGIEASEGKKQVGILSEEVGKRELEEKQHREACEECRKKITMRSEEREALNPGLLRKENERLLNRRHSLQEFSSILAKAVIEKEDTRNAEKELTETVKLLGQLKEISERAASECGKAEKEMKAAEERYLTMLLSVDRNFKELRRKLAEEHASNCPLCGQSITEHLKEWNTEEYFSGLLLPLEDEKKKLTDAYSIAKRKSEEAEKEMNTTAGSLKAKESELQKKKRSLSESEAEIEEKIRLLEMTESSDWKGSIEKELLKNETEIAKILEKLAVAEKIQKEIDALIKQKESLDKLHRDADSLLQESLRDLTRQKENVKNAEARLTELSLDIQNLRENITKELKGYSDDWQNNPSEEIIRLKNDSDEFTERSSRFIKDTQEHHTLLKTLESLTEIQEILSEQLDGIEGIAESLLLFNVESLNIETLKKKWNEFLIEVSTVANRRKENESNIGNIENRLNEYYLATGTTENTLCHLLGAAKEVNEARARHQKHREDLSKNEVLLTEVKNNLEENLKALQIEDASQIGDIEQMKKELALKENQYRDITQQLGVSKERLDADEKTRNDSELLRAELEKKTLRFERWEKMNRYFGGTRFRTLVQSHLLRPLLNNANVYLRQITDHYTLTCSDDNEQLSILVLDRYNNNEPRSVTVLSGGERFIISLALSLALSAMNRPDLNVDILFIDEGFGTLDAKSLDMVMSTLRRLPQINGQTGRRVGVISHREELTEQIPVQIRLRRSGEGRSRIEISD